MSIKVESTSEKAPEVKTELVTPEAIHSDDSKSASAAADETTEESDTSDTTESTDDTEESESSEDSSTDESKDKPKKKGGFQKRIDKLTAKAAKEAEEKEFWKAEALKQKKTEEKPATKVDSKPDLTDKPKAEGFDTHEEYVEALTDWKLDQKMKAKELETKQAQVKSQYNDQLKAHFSRMKAFADKTEDFKDVMEDAEDINISIAVQDIVLAADNGPELLYELAKNKAEFARICALPPHLAGRELGKFEASLNKEEPTPKVVQPKTTKAPAPIAPVGSKGSNVKKSLSDPNLTQTEYEKLRREQMAQARA